MDKETIEKALERQDPVFFTPIEIERIWEMCIRNPILEMEQINLVENSLYLDHLEVNCYKAIGKGVDDAEANLEKVQQIKRFNQRSIESIAIKEFQATIIRELRIKLLKMERELREKSEIISNFE